MIEWSRWWHDGERELPMWLPVTLLLLLLAPAVSAQTNGSALKDIGLGIGFDAESESSFDSYEVSATFASPWGWQSGAGALVTLDFEVGAGVLDGEGDSGGFLRVAPLFELRPAGSPIGAFVTTGPMLLTEDQYGDLDLGGKVHFATAIGATWRVTDGWSIGYRFQHISNIGLKDPNPGLDQHQIRVARSF